MTEAEYAEACEENMGYCQKCKAFTTSCCEPDAHECECEECGEFFVYGTEEALLMGMIQFTE